MQRARAPSRTSLCAYACVSQIKCVLTEPRPSVYGCASTSSLGKNIRIFYKGANPQRSFKFLESSPCALLPIWPFWSGHSTGSSSSNHFHFSELQIERKEGRWSRRNERHKLFLQTMQRIRLVFILFIIIHKSKTSSITSVVCVATVWYMLLSKNY